MMSKTSTRIDVVKPSGVARPVHLFRSAGDSIAFEDGYIHYVHSDALVNITQMTIKGLKNAEIHFLGKLFGEHTFEDAWRDDVAILNIVDCDNVLISGADITNQRYYAPGNIQTRSSCALNVSRSTVAFVRCRFTSSGKSTVAIHSGSDVAMRDVVISGFYFELTVGASKVVMEDLTIVQDNEVESDSHSAIWVSSSMRHGVTNKLFEETEVKINNAILDMKSGRSIVSGNGSYNTMSLVDLRSIKFGPDRDTTFGIVTLSSSYHSINVTTDFGDAIEVDLVSTPDVGFGRFVDWYDDRTFPAAESPISVDGFSSEELRLQV